MKTLTAGLVYASLGWSLLTVFWSNSASHWMLQDPAGREPLLTLRKQPAHKQPARPASPDFAFIIASARRDKDAFYLNETIDALLEAKVPAKDTTLLNADVLGRHVQLEAYVQQHGSIDVLQRSVNITTMEDLAKVRNLRIRVHPSDIRHDTAAVNDTEERTLWRSKEVMDFVLLANHALKKHQDSQWIEFLQDDAVLIKESVKANQTALLPTLRWIVEKRAAEKRYDLAYYNLAHNG